MSRWPDGVKTWTDGAYKILEQWCVAQVRLGKQEILMDDFIQDFTRNLPDHLPTDGRSWGSLASTAQRRGLLIQIAKVEQPPKVIKGKTVTYWGIKL